MSILSSARYIASAHDLDALPADIGAEVAFAGRSNAGKSSAINALAQRRKLAFVSKTPGRTQTINFFDCGGDRRLVDLPGYGYAAVPQRERAPWGRLISEYLQGRESLRGLVVIVDARHPLTPLDRQLLGWHAPSGQPVLVLLTKADKLSRSQAAQALKAGQELLPQIHPNATAQLFSAVTGTGQHQARAVVNGLLK
jgi:GTP-binding protein